MIMTFQKSRRAKSKDDFETWIESDITNTLNAFEGGDTRSTTLIVIEHENDNTNREEVL